MTPELSGKCSGNLKPEDLGGCTGTSEPCAAPERHPGGLKATKRLISLSGIEPCRVLDMGAGDGSAVRLLRELGFDAFGIDKSPGEGPGNGTERGVEEGDMLESGYEDGSFDAVLSECAFFVSGEPAAALREARRLLPEGGKLLLSDVFRGNEAELEEFLADGGFRLICCEDISGEWKRYYIERIWDGSAEEFCSPKGGLSGAKDCSGGMPIEGKFRYFLSVSERM